MLEADIRVQIGAIPRRSRARQVTLSPLRLRALCLFRTRLLDSFPHNLPGSTRINKHGETTSMITRRRLLTSSTAAVFAPALVSSAASAQGGSAWPTRPVRMIVPFPPGGGTDNLGRILAARLSEMWGQQVVIENRAGAGSNIGTEAAAKSEPDGYTFLFATIGLAINPFMYKSLGYDPLKDLAPITILAEYPNVLAVSNASPVKSVAELVEHAKKNPGMTYGSSGIGTTPHLSGEMFARMAGVQMTHVPYRGAGPAIADLIPGRIDFMFNTIGAMLGHVRKGSVRGLAVSSRERFFTAPELPSVHESGVPNFDIMGWYAFAAPANTPKEIIAKINADTITAMREPEIKKRVEAVGVGIVGSTPETMTKRIIADMAIWEPVIKAAGISQ
jgi:tripartite-type tricarboxylate transporter receptor subunit TctC